MKTVILATTLRETEKALQIKATYKHIKSGAEKTWTTWVPKSHAKVVRDNAVELSSWLANKIDKEICEFYRCFAMPNQLNMLIQNG